MSDSATGEFNPTFLPHNNYEVIVIGGGHAGCEAALASARMGARTLLLTINMDNVALMPCNPSIGGPAKGHLVREIDALGGEMGKITDRTFIQIRMLNTSKGPAVQALRAQADKRLYALTMKQTLESTPNLTLKQALVDRLLSTRDPQTGRLRACGIVTTTGTAYSAKSVVVTTGTFLRGRIIVGDTTYAGGRSGEQPSVGFAESLIAHGFPLYRLKTGTPPRIDARTIDYTKAEFQFGSPVPLQFSYTDTTPTLLPAIDVYPNHEPRAWRPQLPCYLIHTNESTHAAIRRNIHRAPLYTGVIEGTGPRYCPSIEDKVVRFAEKLSHQIFLEPEGWQTYEVYVQGMNTSLPEDVQEEMLRSIPALRNAEIMRAGYAVEYDAVRPGEIMASMETKRVHNLFFAGQINGTSGYEEAAAQGLMAGINAVLRLRNEPPFMLRRDEAYIGVLIDDLTTKEIVEPYRLMTSRAEYRLLLRSDNADLRLTPHGARLGLVSAQKSAHTEEKRQLVAARREALKKIWLRPNQEVNQLVVELGHSPLARGTTAAEFIQRPDATYAQALRLIERDASLVPHTEDAAENPVEEIDISGILNPLKPREGRFEAEVVEQVEIVVKYSGYLDKQNQDIARFRRMEEKHIPAEFDFDCLIGARIEAREKMKRFRPVTVGQASRLAGVNPADVNILLVRLSQAENGQLPRPANQK